MIKIFLELLQNLLSRQNDEILVESNLNPDNTATTRMLLPQHIQWTVYTKIAAFAINPYLPSGPIHPFQLDESIPIFIVILF